MSFGGNCRTRFSWRWWFEVSSLDPVRSCLEAVPAYLGIPVWLCRSVGFQGVTSYTLSWRHREGCQLETRGACNGSVACEGVYFLVRASADPNSFIPLCAPTNAQDCNHKIMSRHRGWLGDGFYSIVSCLPLLGLGCLIAYGLLAHSKVPVAAMHSCFDHWHIL